MGIAAVLPGGIVSVMAEVVGDLALESGLQEPSGQLLEQSALASQLQVLGLSPATSSSISRSSIDFDGTASDGSTVSASVTLTLVIGASSMIGSYTERFTVPIIFVSAPRHQVTCPAMGKHMARETGRTTRLGMSAKPYQEEGTQCRHL